MVSIRSTVVLYIMYMYVHCIYSTPFCDSSEGEFGRLRSSKVGPPSSAEEYDRGRVILADFLAAATPII